MQNWTRCAKQVRPPFAQVRPTLCLIFAPMRRYSIAASGGGGAVAKIESEAAAGQSPDPADDLQPAVAPDKPLRKAKAVKTYRHMALYFGFGQSLMEGVSRSKSVMTKRPVARGRALMFETGARAPRVAYNPEKRLSSATFWEVTDLQSRWNEQPLTEATRAILPALRADEAILTANFGRRRMAFLHIAPGGDLTVYTNVKTALAHIAATAKAVGAPLSQMIVSWIHGHADRDMDKVAYRRALKGLHSQLRADFAALSGHDGNVMICASQTCAALDNADPPHESPIANAYWLTAQKHADFFFLACPEYFLGRSFDGVHLTPQATALLGAYHGRAIARRLRGEAWQPLHMASATRDGTVVTVRFAGGTGPLVFHHDDGAEGQVWGVRNLPHCGFRWEQSDLNNGAVPPPVITQIDITAPREITLTLSAPPRKTTAEILSLGFFQTNEAIEGFVKGQPATGNGLATNIRTQNDETDHFGNPLHDWALLQRCTVTRAAKPPEGGSIGAAPTLAS